MSSLPVGMDPPTLRQQAADAITKARHDYWAERGGLEAGNGSAEFANLRAADAVLALPEIRRALARDTAIERVEFGAGTYGGHAWVRLPNDSCGTLHADELIAELRSVQGGSSTTEEPEAQP